MNKILVSLLLSISLMLSACGEKTRRYPLGGNNMNAELNQCLRLSAKKKYDEAVECLEVFKSRYPGSGRAAEADLKIADNYFRQKEYLVAAETYQDFIKRYPYHDKLDYAYYRSGQAYALDVPKALDRDQQYLDLAEKNFDVLLRFYRHSPYHKVATHEYQKVRLKQAQKHYYIARYYYKYGEYLASLSRFKKIIDEYSGLGLDEKCFYYMIQGLFRVKRLDAARVVFDEFKSRHPNSKYVKAVASKFS